jgi:hypothetical protein
MGKSERGQGAIILPMLLAALLHDAGAQAPATVVITAPRPVDLEGYRATEARINDILLHRPAPSSPFLSWCMEHRFARENAAFSAGSLPLQDNHSLAIQIKCGRAHIEAKDTDLKHALDAFDNRDYAAALAFFRKTYAKLGTLDAALMLAKMHFDGLGTPRDTAQGIAWLRETAAARFDPKDPQAMNAHIEAATMLARVDAPGDGMAPDMSGPAHPSGKADQPDAERAVGKDVPEESATSKADFVHVTADADRAGPRDQAGSAGAQVVRVTGLRAIPWKSYRAMRAAVAAFDKYKFLAPDAVFRFAVLPPAGKTLPPNFALRVRTRDGAEFVVPLEHDEMFQLPVVPDPDAEADLVSNLKDGPLRIGLLVRTPGVPSEKERLGDVRLRAEISQAIADVDHPSDDPRCMRKTLLLPRHCRPMHVTVWYKPRAPASGAWLVDGNRREALASNGDPDYPAYKIPVNAGHLGNDLIIEFDYKNPLGPMKHAAVAIYDANE